MHLKYALAGAAAAALALFGTTAATASTGARPAATPACASTCFDLSSLALGRGTIQNAYVPGDTGVGGKAGQKVNLNFASNSHPNEDFTGAQVGTLADFCNSVLHPQGPLPSDSYACINYPGFFPVFESNWSPFGNESDLCVGAALPVASGENVTLRACGTTASTLWVGDLKNEKTVHGHAYFPLVNGGFTGFSHPADLTVDPGTKAPVNQLKLGSLNALTAGTTPDTQMFTLVFGEVS